MADNKNDIKKFYYFKCHKALPENSKLDQKIQKDATSKVPSTRPNAGKACNSTVPSIVVHNGLPTILCSSVEGASSSIEFVKKPLVEGENSDKFKMSLGDEPVVTKHSPTANNMSAQRPINCLPIPPSVSPPVKQNSLTSLTPGTRNLTKSNSVPSRPKVDRSTSLTRQECFETECGVMPAVQRLRGNPKVKLLQRSHAVREETSPPREVEHGAISQANDKVALNKTVNGVSNSSNSHNHLNNSNSNSVNNNKAVSLPSQASSPYPGGNNLQVTNNRPNSRHKLKHQGSSQGSMDNSSPCLSRDSSTEQYTDNSGIDLNQFIADTLNRNYKDRMILLQIEQDLISLVKDNKRAYQKFPVMSSYQRMLVHRVAAFFGMDHNVDQSGHCVVVNITSSTRIPEVRFSELIREDCRFLEEPRRCILKRDSGSFEEGMHLRSPERQLSGDSRRSKSFEEREEEYERARKRIFNRDDGHRMSSPYRSHDINSRRNSHEDLRWHGESQAWSSSDSDICNNRNRQNASRVNRISKVESFESNDTLKANSLKGSVSKSYSFGGYPGMVRGDSMNSSSPRTLMKQADSVTSSVSSSRLSPSSSGYKSQSVRSDATTSTTPSPNQATSQCSYSPEPNTVVWAVSSLTAVPPGAVLINPASGQPYTNPDGSLYRYDPDNPIKLCTTIEEDVSTNSLSSPASGTIASSNDSPEHVIKEKSVVDTSENLVNLESSGTVATTDKSNTLLINSSTSPSLPELPHNDDAVSPKNVKVHYLDSNRIEQIKKVERSTSRLEDTSRANPDSGQMYSNNADAMSVEGAQTSHNECENNISSDNIGGNGGGSVTNYQNDSRDYSGQNSTMSYQVNFTPNSTIQATPEYGSHTSVSGAYINSNAGVAPMNYSVGSPFSTETVQMPPEMLYSQPVIYAAGQQANYNVVHASNTATNASQPPPMTTPVPPPSVPPVSTQAYEPRPNELNPGMPVPELNNYFMGLNMGSEQIPSAATPAPQIGYWGPSPSTSQTQGSSHSSHIQMYYVPGSLPTGAIHPKYTPAAPSMYTYNVPPVVYPTELCQPMIPNTAATAVYPTPYYPPPSNSSMSYRAPTPPTPSAVTATAVAPSFFVYHPQSAAPPAAPQIQFGMVRPQQQVPGIRSSPPPGPRPRMPYNRSMSERTRHTSINLDPKNSNLHFSSPLSMYGLRFVPGEIQSIGMIRPVANVRPVTPASVNSNQSHHPVSQGSGNESIFTGSRPPRPRKQR